MKKIFLLLFVLFSVNLLAATLSAKPKSSVITSYDSIEELGKQHGVLQYKVLPGIYSLTQAMQ